MARLKAKFLACLLLAGYCLSLQQYDGLDRKKRSSSSSSSSPAAQSAQSVHPELAVRHSHRPAEEDVSSREKKKGKAKGGEHMDLDPFEGARLAEGALRIFARTAKLTADALRVVGDTAAGVGGSGVKVVGSAVKSVGSVIENSADEAMRRNDDEGGSKFAHVTRKVAGHGVKVMSTMVKGVGESFMLVGQATGEGFILYAMRVFFFFFFFFFFFTSHRLVLLPPPSSESVTAGTAGVAEDTVRVVEELLGTFADHMNPSAASSHHSSSSSRSSSSSYGSDSSESREAPSSEYISFSQSFSASSFWSISIDEPLQSAQIVASLLKAWIVKTLTDSMDDVAGVPSVIPEIAGVFIICFIVGLWLRSRTVGRVLDALERDGVSRAHHGEGTSSPSPRPQRISSPSGRSLRGALTPTAGDVDEGGVHHTLPVLIAEKVEPSTPTSTMVPAPPPTTFLRRLFTVLSSSTLFSFLFHFLVFLYVTKIIMMQTNQVKRSAETKVSCAVCCRCCFFVGVPTISSRL